VYKSYDFSREKESTEQYDCLLKEAGRMNRRGESWSNEQVTGISTPDSPLFDREWVALRDFTLVRVNAGANFFSFLAGGRRKEEEKSTSISPKIYKR
jgi:hypothetical protein